MLKDIEVTQDLIDYIYDHTQPLHPVQKDILNYKKRNICHARNGRWWLIDRCWTLHF